MRHHETNRTPVIDRAGFLKTEVAAKYLGIKKTTLEAWRCRGGGPRYVKLGRAVRYRVQDLDRFVEKRLCAHTTEDESSYRGGADA